MQYLIYEERPRIQDILLDASSSDHTYLKFLSANDLQLTGSHQSGIYLCSECWPLFFDSAGKDGENKERNVKIKWPGSYESTSRFIWYGKKSRNEYRLTGAVGYFKGHEERYLGSLLVLTRKDDAFRAWAVEDSDDIDAILNFFGLSAAETNSLIQFDWDERLLPYLKAFPVDAAEIFPETEKLAHYTIRIFEDLYGIGELPSPDRAILDLIHIEYSLFRYIEKIHYEKYLVKPFPSLDKLLSVSLQINNRRKSRAGRSLENHIKYVLDRFCVSHTHGGVTSEGTRPDFIFPGIEQYNDAGFPRENLFFLAAKTTCKDRWRQVLNETRTTTKYLFTLQQGISSAQLREMDEAGVILVMPDRYHSYCKEADRARLLSFSDFIDRVVSVNGRQERLL